MNKKVIVLILGIVCIVCGIVLLFLINDKKGPNYSIMVDTSVKTGDTIDNHYYDYYSSELTTDYVKGYDLTSKNKYIFSYPVGLTNTYLSEYTKGIEGENFYLDIKQDLNFDLQTKLSEITDCYKSNGYTDFNYSESKEIKIGNYDAGYVKIEALDNADIDIKPGDKYYSECFLLYVKIDDRTLVLDYRVYNKRFSDLFLSQLASGVEVGAGSATYLSSSVVNNEVVGTISQISYLDQARYDVNYHVSSEKYKELENIKNNYSYVVFGSIDNSLEVGFKIISADVQDGVSSFLVTVAKNTYVENKELYDVSVYNEEDVSYQEKNYHKISMTYRNLENNLTYHYVQLITEIDDLTAVAITYIQEDEITDDVLLDFLDYSVNQE